MLIFGAMRLTFLLLLLLLAVSACKTPDPRPVEMGETKIGRQVWMRENLRVDTFRNGDPIKHAQSPEAWAEALSREEPAWCFYDNDPDNAGLTGMLWTSTVNLSKMSWYREVNFFSGRLYRTFNYREDAFSVRCLKLVIKKQEPPQPWIGDK